MFLQKVSDSDFNVKMWDLFVSNAVLVYPIMKAYFDNQT